MDLKQQLEERKLRFQPVIPVTLNNNKNRIIRDTGQRKKIHTKQIQTKNPTKKSGTKGRITKGDQAFVRSNLSHNQLIDPNSIKQWLPYTKINF